MSLNRADIPDFARKIPYVPGRTVWEENSDNQQDDSTQAPFMVWYERESCKLFTQGYKPVLDSNTLFMYPSWKLQLLTRLLFFTNKIMKILGKECVYISFFP